MCIYIYMYMYMYVYMHMYIFIYISTGSRCQLTKDRGACKHVAGLVYAEMPRTESLRNVVVFLYGNVELILLFGVVRFNGLVCYAVSEEFRATETILAKTMLADVRARVARVRWCTCPCCTCSVAVLTYANTHE